MAQTSTSIVLAVEVSAADALYRIRRIVGQCNHVVYITVNNISIIPEDERTEARRILKNLKRFKEWEDQTWRTIEINKVNEGVEVKLDTTPVYSLKPDQLLGTLPRYDIFTLPVSWRSKHSVLRVSLDGREGLKKIAQLPYQLRYLLLEIRIYHALAEKRPLLTPKLLGYVYEEHVDRVIGFVCDVVDGDHPISKDRGKCLEALRTLHAQGLLHGDLNRRDIIIAPSGDVRFIDFECATLSTDIHSPDFVARMEKETNIMQHCALDDDKR